MPKLGVKPAELPSAIVPAPNTSHREVQQPTDDKIAVDAVLEDEILPIEQAAIVFDCSARTIYRKCVECKELAVRGKNGRIVGVRRTVVEKLRYKFTPLTPAEVKQKMLERINKILLDHERANPNVRVPIPDPLVIAVEVGCSVRMVEEALVQLQSGRRCASILRAKEAQRIAAENKAEAEALRAQMEAEALAEEMKRRHEERETDLALKRMAKRPPIPLEHGPDDSPDSTAAAE